MSSNPEAPWVAVGLQPGDMLKPKGFKLVYCYSWNSRKLEQIFDSGEWSSGGEGKGKGGEGRKGGDGEREGRGEGKGGKVLEADSGQ